MQIVSVKSQSALSGVQKNLREGDFVFARVLKNLGGGNYLVSFAGGRFAAMSAQNLVAGQTFKAQVFLESGGLVLKIVPGGDAQGGGENFVKAFSALSPEAQEFLAALGLPADNVSARILQHLTQSGSKLDARLMQKVRRLAQRFKGREAEAAEAALALEEKGVDSESSALDQIMDALGGKEGGEAGSQEGGQQDGQDQKDSKAQEQGQACDYAQILGEVKRFFSFAEGLSQEKIDGLALFNHLRGKGETGQKGWVFFPFEYQIKGGPQDEAEEGKGTLRLYLDYERRSLEKMVINFKSICANLFFALYLKDKKVRKLIVSGAGQENLEELKNSFGRDVKVEVADLEEISTFGAEDLPIFGVEGFA